MIRSVLLWLTLCVASSSVGAEPFIVFEGKDAAVPKQPQACVSASGVVHVTFGAYLVTSRPRRRVSPRLAAEACRPPPKRNCLMEFVG